jgi:hypothetical protein
MKTISKEIKLYKLAFIFIAIAVLTTCSTSQRITFPSDLNDYAVGKEFEVLNEYLLFSRENDKYSVYNAKNTISYLMDLGLAEHFAGNYQESLNFLLEAERLIWEAYTKSVSEGFKALGLVNPYKAEYQGEDFENIYINIFCALNFYQLGDLEKALVEVRKVNEKLLYMNNEYEKHYNSLSQKIRESSSRIEYYTNSALARYLCVLFWRTIGNMDSARIDATGLSEAFAAAPDLYRHQVPPEMVMRGNLCDETSVPAGMARVNFLSFTGFSPYKIPIRMFWGMPNVKALSYRRAPVDRIEVVFDNGRRHNLSLLEPLDVISQQIFETKEAYRRSVWGLHSYGSFMLDAILMALTLGIYDGKSDAQRNTALDMRMAQLMPGKAYVGGINLAPGTYSFTINYYNGRTIIDSRRIENQTVTANGLNLIQDYCMKFDEVPTPQTFNNDTIASSMPDFPGRPRPPSNFKVEYAETEGVNLAYVSWDPVPGAVAYYIYTDAWDNFSDGDFTLDQVVVKPKVTANRSVTLGKLRAVSVGSGGFSVPSERF